MLAYLKRWRVERVARTRIGVELHRQIKEAFNLNEEQTSVRLQTSFCVGYIYGFVRIGFATITGISGERATDKHLRHICDGVLPGKLYEIFSRQLAALEIARQMEDQDKKIPGMQVSPTDLIGLFEAGGEAGFSDAGCFASLSGQRANNLTKYLVGELDDRPFRKEHWRSFE